MDKIKNLLKNEPVTMVSFILACLSVILVPIDKHYVDYVNYKTLGTLLTLMIIMAGLGGQGFFRKIGSALLARISSLRILGLVLVYLCFFFAMFITNDVALITFVPFTIEVLMMAGMKNYLIPIIVLQTIAANLGSMLTPIGNPHNLYLYDLSDMSPQSFIGMMLPYSLLSFALLTVMTCLLAGRKKIENSTVTVAKHGGMTSFKTGMYLVLFLLSLTIVLRVLPYYIVLGVVVLVVIVFDRKNFLEVDYFLLLTFTFLFIFIGNIKRMDAVNDILTKLVSGNEFAVSIATSQFICNIPATILISNMTTDYSAVCIGADFGGLGTLIASMASLISFKLYSRIAGSKKGKYVLTFTLFSIIFLVFLIAEYMIIN
ncbi:MAG: citrate transporter [Eubacterium sp.]|nr:citrate transporter [Eubacterium sp.]